MYMASKAVGPAAPGTGLVQFSSGLGGCGCGCGKCGRGLGLFDSGVDISGWSWPEYATAGLGLYVLSSVLFTTKRAARALGSIPGERRKRKAAKYRKLASDLSKK